MISSFFIDRPIFACVIAIIITLSGLLALSSLPIEQYPNITPPQIMVQTNYPGASADTVADTVAAPIEQQVNSAENIIYMYSQSSSSGDMVLNVFFDIGTEIEQAQIDVQNQVNLAMPQLPEDVRKQGITIKKQSPTILLMVALQSPDGRYDDIYTSNYASINIIDELQRLRGVSNVQIIGARDYSMRVWLKPDRMAQLGISTSDVVDAIRDQNAQFAVGQIGQQPTKNPLPLQLPIVTQGRLSDPHEFDDIIIVAKPDGSMVQIRDIGHTELGAANYDVNAAVDGKPTTMIAIYQQYGANALDVANEVRSTMQQLSESFPAGLEYSIPYDTTSFIIASITEVQHTIFEAAVLVVLVVFVFLQSFRATLIPLLAMVVSIVGAFAGMYVLGMSLNTLTLFGLVLAIGIVVDDAIVVIENVERNMREFKLPPTAATHKAMEEVTGPVIAIVFVLCAVFIPVTFLGGMSGQLYKQFALTISISVVVSGIVALTLSPAIAQYLIKVEDHHSRFAIWFNNFFDKSSLAYVEGAKWLINRTTIALAGFATLLLLIHFLFIAVPTGFVPEEDQGYVMALAKLPDGASLTRTQAITDMVEAITEKNPAVDHTIALTGYSLIDGINRPNQGSYFITLKDWSERRSAPMQVKNILRSFNKQFWSIPESQLITFNPPAIQGMGTVGGFEFWIENRGPGDQSVLEGVARDLIAKARDIPSLQGLSTTIDASSKQLYVDLDRYKARSLGVPIAGAFQSLQSLLGTLYVNDFNKFGKVFKVIVQAEPQYRNNPDSIGQIYVKSTHGQMVPLNSLINVRNVQGPTLVSRFNGFPAAKINGDAAPGYSSGEAMEAMEKLAKEVLPEDMSFSWGGQSYQEKVNSGASTKVFIMGLVMVFLILAALYENWSLPFSIILAVPFGVFGALAAVWIMQMSNDIYFQIGMLTLIALSAKNAILIIEFAVIKSQEGMSFLEAALHAARLRFRAILMTSLTFIFGVIPLVLSSGAGAASRHSVGTGVLGGMVSATFLAIFFVPFFYKFIQEVVTRRKQEAVKEGKQVKAGGPDV